MKNNKYFLRTFALITTILLSFASCENLLDEPRENRAFDPDVTPFDYVVGAYASVQTRGWEDYPLISVRGDDVNAGGLGDQQDYMETDFFNYNKDYWMYNSVWQNLYRDIIDVISAQDQIQTYKDNFPDYDVNLANQYIAETKVLRGWMLFQLSRVWGDVFIPNSTSPTDFIGETVPAKDEVMQSISDLMDEAIPDLADMRPNERDDIPGGVTKYTALAVKALANLELENYQEVANATGEIMNEGSFMLEPDFYELFKKPGKLSSENLFELQYSDYGTPNGGAANLYTWAFFGPQGWSPAVTGSSPGWGFYEPSLKFIKFMLDRGEMIRLQTSVCFTDRGIDEITSDPAYATLPAWISNTTPDGDVFNDYSRAMFASGKHYLPSNQLTPGRTSYGAGKNMIAIRYAEVLLMYAEALTHGATGTAGTADSAINMIRLRAGLGNISGVTLENVMDEKFAEMGLEWGIRYYDMLRLGWLDELSYDDHTFSEAKRFLPYPQLQVDQIPVLGGDN